MSVPTALNGETRVYGILGHPVRHSLSPALQNAGFQALGLNSAYLAFPVAPERLPEALAGLAAADVAGLNLTVPHKSAVIPLLAELSPEARAIGAVNTIRHTERGWIGTNTDGLGFMRSLESDLAWRPAGKTVLMLGAGGSARAIAWSLLSGGVAQLLIANRTPERAEALAASLRAGLGDNPGGHFGGEVGTVSLEQVAGSAPDLLVNTTTVGMGDGNSPVELAPIGVRDGVIDIIYAPAETPLLTQARTLGLPHTNGVGMLLFQGAAAFQFWTDREPPVDVMREALESALAARGT